MNHTIKIGAYVRPVNTLHTLVVCEDSARYTPAGTSIPPDEANAREIAQQAVRWIAFATERTRMHPPTVQQKGVESACFSTLKRASSFAVPSKLVGVGAHQRTLWKMTRSRVPAWTPLALDPGENRVAVLYDGEVIGHLQPKHYGWVKPLIPFGVGVYLSKITGSERSGYLLGLNVVFGHVGAALDRLLDALGDAGFGSAGGDGAGPRSAPLVDSQPQAQTAGDGAAGSLRLVTPSTPVRPGADPHDVVLFRDVRGIAHATVEHIVRHSPSGLEWGYSGSGPADLARSVLLAFADEATADRLYQDFKAEVIDAVPFAGGVIRAVAVRAWLAARSGTERR